MMDEKGKGESMKFIFYYKIQTFGIENAKVAIKPHKLFTLPKDYCEKKICWVFFF